MLDGKRLRVALQAGDITLARHLLGMLEAVFRAAQILHGDGDLRVGGLHCLRIGPLDVFLHRDLGGRERLLRFDLHGLGLFDRQSSAGYLVFERRGVEPHQLVALVDLSAVGDQPQDRAAAGHLALDVDVASSFPHCPRR